MFIQTAAQRKKHLIGRTSCLSHSNQSDPFTTGEPVGNSYWCRQMTLDMSQQIPGYSSASFSLKDADLAQLYSAQLQTVQIGAFQDGSDLKF